MYDDVPPSLPTLASGGCSPVHNSAQRVVPSGVESAGKYKKISLASVICLASISFDLDPTAQLTATSPAVAKSIHRRQAISDSPQASSTDSSHEGRHRVRRRLSAVSGSWPWRRDKLYHHHRREVGRIPRLPRFLAGIQSRFDPGVWRVFSKCMVSGSNKAQRQWPSYDPVFQVTDPKMVS